MSNQTTARRLLAAMSSHRATHAQLLSGQWADQCNELAFQAAAMCCTGRSDPAALVNCPRFVQLGPAPILVDDIRQLEERLSYRLDEGQWQCVLLLRVQDMTVQAQNAFLKTLEEPPPRTEFLLCGQEAGVLPTIRSRCTIWRLGAEPVPEVAALLTQEGIPADTARLAAALSGGVADLARSMAAPVYQSFYKEALSLLEAAVGTLPPFADMKKLLSLPFEAEPVTRTDAEQRRAAASACLHIWQCALRDALLHSCGIRPVTPMLPGAEREVQNLAHRFTSEQIQGIIKEITDTEKRLYFKANPSLTMDRLLICLQSAADQTDTEEI